MLPGQKRAETRKGSVRNVSRQKKLNRKRRIKAVINLKILT